jgi:adenylate cyclase
MDLLSRIASWLGENEATISAVVGITVLAGVVFAGVRWLLLRGTGGAPERLLVRPSRGTVLIAGSAALLLLLAGVVAWLVWPDEPTEEPTAGRGPKALLAADSSLPGFDSLTVPGFGGRPAIAVLPFDNLSGDPDQEYFADGIAEDLTTRLSRWRYFPVIARNSSFTYKGKPVDVKQVSRELGARYLVEGSVRKAGDRVRINAQLIDAATGAHVWAEAYDRELSDTFAIQDEITEAIVSSMEPALWSSERKRVIRAEPRNLGAYDYAMRGLWHLYKGTAEDNTAARSLFEKATELDPEDPLGFSGLAWAHYLDILFQWTDSPARSLDGQFRAARRCVELDGTLADCHVITAWAFSLAGQREQAIASARLAVELEPSQSYARMALGLFLGLTGEPGEGIAHLERAMRLSPQDPAMNYFLHCIALAHFAAGSFEEAVQWERQSLQRDPDYYIARGTLAASYAHLGELTKAQTALQEMLRRNPEFSPETFQMVFSFADTAVIESWLDGVRKAGWSR